MLLGLDELNNLSKDDTGKLEGSKKSTDYYLKQVNDKVFNFAQKLKDFTFNISDILFNWDDGTQPNDGFADHIGFVEAVNGNVITCIEGNISEAVGRRNIYVGWGYIRGYARPKYGSSSSAIIKTETTASKPVVKNINCTVTLSQLQNGAKNEQVKARQRLLIANGYSCGKHKDDGDFGNDTETAVKKYQKTNKLEVDGIVGTNTWNKLLGIK